MIVIIISITFIFDLGAQVASRPEDQPVMATPRDILAEAIGREALSITLLGADPSPPLDSRRPVGRGIRPAGG